jgi:hypothetical protein
LTSRIFSTDSDLDKELAKGTIPLDEIKIYPGSIKGPEPEDDPESYSKWFYDNQPKSTLRDGVVIPESIGAKTKLLKMVQDGTALNEFLQPMPAMLEADDKYPMQGYTGQPEFELYERESYNVANDKDLPQLTYTSNTGVNELMPQHNDNTLDYQKLHPELERWAIFRSLPPLLNYEKTYMQQQRDIQAGLMVVPKYT